MSLFQASVLQLRVDEMNVDFVTEARLTQADSVRGGGFDVDLAGAPMSQAPPNTTVSEKKIPVAADDLAVGIDFYSDDGEAGTSRRLEREWHLEGLIEGESDLTHTAARTNVDGACGLHASWGTPAPAPDGGLW